MDKKLISNLIVVSDLHCGCRLALCHPDGVHLDDGGEYKPSELQLKLWQYWEYFWEEWVPKVTRDEPYAVVLNGDAIDGVHHNSVTQISQNLVDQRNLAEKILRPIVARCCGRFYAIRGTEAHDGNSAGEMETLAKSLGAIPDSQGQYSRWEMQIRIGNGPITGLVDLAHHIGTAGSMAYETSAIQKELEQIYVECARWAIEAPLCVVRSHRHRNAETRVLCSKGFATSCTTAGWQLKTPFAYRVAGARRTQPQIGGTLVRCGDEDCIYTRHQVWSIDRSPTEECYVEQDETKTQVQATRKPADNSHQRDRGRTGKVRRTRPGSSRKPR